jgi:NADPH:quinone reductase-like Zn-dependent oxidoreductase
MRVVRLRAPGGPEQLAVEEADRPQPGPGQALVRVHAAAITRGELDWPVDRLPTIPSYELSGVVEEVGPGVASVAAGDEVFALTPYDRDGGAADYTAVPAEHLVAKPRALGHAESAAIPLPALSAWQGLFDHGRLGAGERVLIHGAAGSVGGYAVQFARAAGAHVIGTASAASLDLVLALGAHEAVDAATRFEDAVEPVDVVFDTAGGERLRRSFAVLGAGGRLISVAEEPPDGGVYFIVEPNRDQLTSIARLVDAGELRRPSIDVFPLASAREAFTRSVEPRRPDKVVLAVAGIPSGRNMTALRTTIAGIAIPDSALAREATEFVRDPSKDQPRDLPHEAGDVGGVVEDAAQGIRHRGHLAAGRLEDLDDAVPARRVGEGAVDQDDGQRGVEGCL